MSLWAAEGVALEQARGAALAFLQRLRPSIAVLGTLGHPTGAAALIDARQGLFLAHADAVRGDTVQARIGDGGLVLSVLARDARTSLVLLGTKIGNTPLGGPAIELADGEPAEGTKVMVLLANDAIVGSFVGGNRFSLRDDRKQVVPVSELRFETPPRLVGGALVFTPEGRLVGAMGATVSRGDRENAAPPGFGAMTGQARGFASNKVAGGPGDITVAYTPSRALVRRVVEGFLSEDHQPEYAVLGIQVADAPEAGVRVRTVTPGYPADRAGVRVGDVLLGMGDYAISRRGDFIRAMLEIDPGAKARLRLRRGANEFQAEVTFARSKG